jgi:RND family efflux transporter MFP subunit
MIRPFVQWVVFLAAILLLLAVVFLVRHQVRVQANQSPPQKTVTARHPEVSVVHVQAAGHEARVTAHGAAAPHFELVLTARVAGRVETLAPSFETGGRVKKGDLLADLEDSDYRAAVAAAQKDLNDARLALLEEQRKGVRAKAEWTSSGMNGEPESALVLRQPQLAVAEAAVANAEAALLSARKNLDQTRITAPFDALVVARRIAPGSYLQPGTEIATLYSTDRVEIKVSLPADAWGLLPAADLIDSGRWPAVLSDIQDGRQWSGRVLRAARHLDDTTRQRSLILALDQPFDCDPPLLPGTFVRATIPGRRLDTIWQLPSSAFSPQGEVWYVTDDNTLAAFAAHVLFSDGDTIHVAPPEGLAVGTQRVLAHPLNSYLAGMTVNPVVEVGHE